MFRMGIFILYSVISMSAYVYGFQCRNEDGQPVDWYVAYKLPTIKKASDGCQYMFMTSDNDKTWTISEKSIQQNDSILGWTLREFYQENLAGFWLSYNDQSGKGSETTYGHTKGVIAADAKEGFWLVHSIPHFPNFDNLTYVYPPTARKNGQSVLCISLDASEIDKIGQLLMYNKPAIWRKATPNSLADLYPKLYAASQGSVVKHSPWYTLNNLKSKTGFEFLGYAKSSEFGKDLYEFVAQSLEVDLYTETWQNEVNPLPSFCTITYKVLNIKSMKISEDILFSSHKDHSKLAISADSAKPFVCIGDINRAKPQESRGGGTLCFRSKPHWMSFFNLIASKDSCS